MYLEGRSAIKGGKSGIRALSLQCMIKGMLTAVRSTSRGLRRIEHLQYLLARLLVPVRAVYDLSLVRLPRIRDVLCKSESIATSQLLPRIVLNGQQRDE